MADEKGISSEMLTGKSSDKNIDCYNDIWAIQFPPVPLGDEEGSIMLRITDENSKINLSVLSNEVFEEEYTPFYGILQRFMLNMGLPIRLRRHWDRLGRHRRLRPPPTALNRRLLPDPDLLTPPKTPRWTASLELLMP